MPESFITPLRLNAHLVEGIDDALRDRIVAAAGAERRLAAAIVENLKANPVRLRLPASVLPLESDVTGVVAI